MYAKIILVPVCLLAAVSCSDVPTGISETSPAIGGKTETNARACSLKAREDYLADAQARGLGVERNADGATVVARSEQQKSIAEDLYRKQLAELSACRKTAS